MFHSLNRPRPKLYKTTSFAHRNLDIYDIPKMQKSLLQLLFRDIWIQVTNKNLQGIKTVRLKSL